MRTEYRGNAQLGQDVIVDGKNIGKVIKTYKHGYNYWKADGTKKLFSTRKEAAISLFNRYSGTNEWGSNIIDQEPA